MYKLEWTDKTFLILGDYLGVVTNYPSVIRGSTTGQGGWVAKILIPMNEDKPVFGKSMCATAQEACDAALDLLGVDKAKAKLVLAKATCVGVGEFTGEIVEVRHKGSDKITYIATCAPSMTRPSVTLVSGVTADEAKKAVQNAFDIYVETMSAVLGAADEICKTHAGKVLPSDSVEFIVQAASDVGFRLPLDDQPQLGTIRNTPRAPRP